MALDYGTLMWVAVPERPVHVYNASLPLPSDRFFDSLGFLLYDELVMVIDPIPFRLHRELKCLHCLTRLGPGFVDVSVLKEIKC